MKSVAVLSNLLHNFLPWYWIVCNFVQDLENNQNPRSKMFNKMMISDVKF